MNREEEQVSDEVEVDEDREGGLLVWEKKRC